MLQRKKGGKWYRQSFLFWINMVIFFGNIYFGFCCIYTYIVRSITTPTDDDSTRSANIILQQFNFIMSYVISQPSKVGYVYHFGMGKRNNIKLALHILCIYKNPMIQFTRARKNVSSSFVAFA